MIHNFDAYLLIQREQEVLKVLWIIKVLLLQLTGSFIAVTVSVQYFVRPIYLLLNYSCWSIFCRYILYCSYSTSPKFLIRWFIFIFYYFLF